MINNNYEQIAFTASARQYRQAVKYLKSERINAIKSSVKDDLDLMREIRTLCKEHGKHYMKNLWKMLKPIIGHIPKKFKFANTFQAKELKRDGIRFFNPDKLEGIQYGIDVFKDLSMREIMFLLYRFRNMAVKRGCHNACEHCFMEAVPAKKTFSTMPYEDFEKITDGFAELNRRINKKMNNKNPQCLVGDGSQYQYNTLGAGEFISEPIALSFDSDGMEIILKDKNGNQYDYIDLMEKIYNSTGKNFIFDTVGWNPNNKELQARAEKYAKYFSDKNNKKKVQQVNLSVNPFNPIYIQSYKLGYRSGAKNDMNNPDILKGKTLYDTYINMAANMLVTFRDSQNLNLLPTYASKSDKGMNGHYYEDLLIILRDVQNRCSEILKSKYNALEQESEIQKINELIEDVIVLERAGSCKYQGRYKKLYDSINPDDKRADVRYTKCVPDINTISGEEYKNFFRNNFAILDANGDIYYSQNENSLRKLGKSLQLSVNGKETPKIAILEIRS